MYACNKCGATVNNPNEACPNCGIVCTSGVVNINEDTRKFPINIFVVIIAVLAILFSVAFMQSGLSTAMVSFEAVNFSLEYDNVKWSAYDLDEEYFALVDNIDTNTFIQMPYEAIDWNIKLDNDENLYALYVSYVSVLSSVKEKNFTNVSSNFRKLEDTNYYYLTADFNSYTDYTSKGKLYVVATHDGKALSILIYLGNKDFSEIEDSVLDVIKSIEM